VATAGKFALVNSTVALSGATACSDASVMDVVGYGSTASCAEGTLFPATWNRKYPGDLQKSFRLYGYERQQRGYGITNVNPRNNATPANICGLPNLSAQH